MYHNIFKENREQKEGITHINGPLLILAGAGTGKTTLLINRIVNMVQNHNIDPSEIMAVTFTNKASREMKERISKIIPDRQFNIGTFHSASLAILRSNIQSLNYGIESNFNIIDQIDQIKLVKQLLIRLNIDTKLFNPKFINNIISRWKDQGIFYNQISSNDIKSQQHQIAKEVYSVYQKELIQSNCMDFGDIILYCNKLFIDNPNILLSYQKQLKYLMIDEYQDTNVTQYLWIRMLASLHKNICCVGDDDQSIYGWRGAEVGNILKFEKDFPDAKIIKLEKNYRSTKNILAAATHIIQNNSTRHKKKLWTDIVEGEKIKISSFWNEKEEARYVGYEVLELTQNQQYSNNDIAILVRAGFQSRVFEEVFISNAIPYQMIGNVKFYERTETKDLLAYIRLSVNMNDNISFERIINKPKRSIGNITLNKIKEYSYDHSCSLFNATKMMLNENIFTKKISDTLSLFISMIESANRQYNNSAIEATQYLLDESEYIQMLKVEADDESRVRIENINEMLRAIEEFDNINQFIEHTALVIDQDDALETDQGRIKIMTLHAAKGLEFEVVFLPGWEEGIFPHQKALQEEGKKGLEEERRLAYVGITRAKKHLFISYAENRYIFYENQRSIPSRFLSEIPESTYDRVVKKNQQYYKKKNASFNNSLINYMKKTSDRNNYKYYTGSKVFHKQLGQGVVLEDTGDYLNILFSDGSKKNIQHNFIEKFL